MSPQFSQNRSIQVRQVPLHIVQPRKKLFADCFCFFPFTKKIYKTHFVEKYVLEGGSFNFLNCGWLLKRGKVGGTKRE